MIAIDQPLNVHSTAIHLSPLIARPGTARPPFNNLRLRNLAEVFANSISAHPSPRASSQLRRGRHVHERWVSVTRRLRSSISAAFSAAPTARYGVVETRTRRWLAGAPREAVNLLRLMARAPTAIAARRPPATPPTSDDDAPLAEATRDAPPRETFSAYGAAYTRSVRGLLIGREPANARQFHSFRGAGAQCENLPGGRCQWRGGRSGGGGEEGRPRLALAST